MIKSEITLKSGISHNTQQLIRNALYNHFKIEAKQRLLNSNDTNYTYEVYLPYGYKITKQTLRDVDSFIDGIIYALNSF